MVRSGDPEATSEIWGTLEELLLGCAVSRHGTRSWDSVAMEVRSRSPSAYHLLLTPECCRERYRDLERRFSAADGEIGGGGGGPGVEIPWLEELRKLRVAELRREVQRYDVSILSLQLKVKTLQEERERSFLGEEDEDDKNGPDRDEEERKNGESPGSTRRNIPGDRISDGDSRRSGRSCKESNSTDPKDEEEKPRAGETEAAPGTEDRRTDRATSGDVKSAGEASYNGSSDTIAKAAAMANTARLPALADSGASLAESKGGEAEAEREGAKESSDVQSSASLSSRQRRRSGRRKVFSGCSSGGDEPETDAVSPGAKRVPAESQPLITFVEFIRAHKFGSVFERRLQSQKSVRYRSMIRRHVDLEMVRGKLEGRGRREAYRSAEFFRDLLLLCYNAIVFYPKSSPESIAAVHLRGLVTKEMAGTIRKPARRPNAEEPIPPAQPFSPPAVSKLKSDPDRASKALEKQTSLVPLTACRKRSSLSGKAAAAGGWKEGKEEKEKQRIDRKEWEVEDETPAKKRTNERSSVSRLRGLRSNKTFGNAGSKGNGVSKSPNSISSPTMKSTAVENSMEATAKSEKKNGGGETVSASKKKGAAEFLIRMKRSSPTSSGTLRSTLRSSASSGGGGGGGKGAEQQKKRGRGDGRKDRHSRQSPGAAASKRAVENSAPVKRSVGRPPKRAAAPPPPPPAKKTKDELGRTPPPSRNRARR